VLLEGVPPWNWILYSSPARALKFMDPIYLFNPAKLGASPVDLNDTLAGRARDT
jgi:hypothetical protein